MTTDASKPLTQQTTTNNEQDNAIHNMQPKTVPSLADVQSFCTEFHVKVKI